MSAAEIGLAEALERAAGELPELADAIRPANGDPHTLARELSPDEAERLLAWLLTEITPAGEELALAWADEPETRSLLLGLPPADLPKPARKALARITHRLRSRGEVLPKSAPPPRAQTLAPLDEQVDEARISAPDPYGARVVYLAADRPSGGVRIFQLVLDDERGALEFEIFETGRSKARRFLRDVARRERWPAAEAPSASVRAVIAAALSQHPADRALPSGLGDWRVRLSEVPAGTARPGELVRQALDAADELEVETLQGWIESAELGPWPPPVETLRDLLARLEEIASGQLVVSDGAREEQIDAALESALDVVYDDARHERLAFRLEETAYVWWKAGREGAEQLLAAADAFRAKAPATRRLARLMLEIALRPALDRARKPEAVGEQAPAEGASQVVTA